MSESSVAMYMSYLLIKRFFRIMVRVMGKTRGCREM